MSVARRARRALRSAKADYLRNDDDGQAMLTHSAAWLATLHGFERSSIALREAVVIELRTCDRCAFAAFQDDFGLPGVRLVDETGRPLSLAELYAAKLRIKLKGAFHGG